MCRCPQLVRCSVSQENLEFQGGQASDTDFRIFPTTGITSYTIIFDTYNIPDRIFLIDADTQALIYDFGYRGNSRSCRDRPDIVSVGGGEGSMTFQVPVNQRRVAVGVDSPCEGTAWTYTITCS